jgi:hypothetical protein
MQDSRPYIEFDDLDELDDSNEKKLAALAISFGY